MASRVRMAGGAPPQVVPNLRIRLLGHVAVEVDEKPFALATPRKTLPILAYVLLHRDAPVPRDFLAYTMWPDETEEAARSRLRSSLYDLVRLFPPSSVPWIVSDTEAVRWNPDAPLWLDVEAFEAASRDPGSYEDAVALYRGDLLEGMYEDWLFARRERVRNLYAQDLDALVSAHRRARNFPKAITYAQRLLEVDPWREDVLRRLIALRHESGDRAGALAEFTRFEERLRAELEIDPMPESLALRDAIARDAVRPDDAPQEPMRAVFTQAASDLPFVGRGSEMAQILEAWSRSARRLGTCVFVGGESGVGKSRLASEAAHAVEEQGGRVIVGVTGAPESTPYQSLIEALRTALALLENAQVPKIWLAAAATLLPELRERVGMLPPLPRLDGEAERLRLFESLAQCIFGLSHARPLCVVLEDLHWAGEATIAALEYLVRRLSSHRVMVLATYREDETPRMHPLRQLRRDGRDLGARSITLQPLTAADVDALMQDVPAFSDRSPIDVYRSSDGNPLFVALLLQGTSDEAERSGEGGVRTLIRRRVETLSPEARTAAEIAALMGTRFSREAVADVTGWRERTADDAFDELMSRRLVRESAGRGLFDCTFSHHVIVDVVVAGAEPERNAARHRRIARFLEGIGAGRNPELVATIARQYDLGRDAAAAAPQYLAAGERAISVGALDEARRFLLRGAELADDTSLRARIVLAQETLAARAGADDERARHLADLDALAAERSDDELRMTVALRRAAFANDRGDRAAEDTALAALSALVGTRDDAQWRARLSEAEARRAIARGDLDAAGPAAKEALEAYDGTGNAAGEAEARYLVAETELYRGNLIEAERLFSEAEQAAARAPNAERSLQALTALYRLWYYRRDMDRCLTVARRCLRTAQHAGDRRAEAEGHQQCAMALIPSHDYESARKHFHAALGILREIRDDERAQQAEINQTQLDSIVGRFEASREAYERALVGYASSKRPQQRISVLLSLSEVLAFFGDGSEAHQRAVEALELTKRMGFGDLEAWAHESIALSLAQQQRYPGAIAEMEEALRRRSGAGSDAWSAVDFANLALWHAAAGDVKTARAHVRRMLASEEELTVTATWPQTCYWVAAQVLRLAGEIDAAKSALERAQRLMESMASRLDDEERRSFAAISWHRDITAAVERDEWPDPPR